MDKRQEANELVKDCITTALLRLMESKTFNHISITEITETAGVARVSFYRNFQGKEDVISKYLDKLLQDWGKNFEKHGNPDTLIESIFSHYYKHKNLFILLYRQGLARLSLQNLLNACGPKDEHENLTAYAKAWFCYGLYGYIEEWFKRGMREPPEKMARLLKNPNSL